MLPLFAALVAASTAVLIFAGGLVTSTGSGLSVPDWPNTYGWFMWAFPLDKMVGGIFYEHLHRLVASTVGFLIVVLAVWLWRAEPRAWVRRLGYLALAAVIVQGILGGITVLWYLTDAISIAHASLAQIVFCLTTTIALVTAPGWKRGDRVRLPRDLTLERLAIVTTAVIYTQIVIGATMRHTGAGLAIPDFPLAFGHLVPPVLLALANAPGLDRSQFRTVRYALSAAAPLAPDVARRVEQRLGIRVIQAYGLTETGPASHHSPLAPERARLESVGVVMADTEQCVVDLETGERVLGPGEVGEICIRGPQLMQGYWNAPEETARALRNGWLYSGDIGYVDEGGYTFIVDRKKEMIKCRAFSVAPAELEATLLEHPDIADCGVVGTADADGGEVPNAFVVPRKGCTLDAAALTDYFATRLAGYKTIRQWEITDAIPRTPSGKILRRVLKQAALSKQTATT